MSKYEPLHEYLRRSGQSSVRLTFAEIEKVLGDKLPASAYKYSAWWANGSHVQANAWLDAGYNADADLNTQIVVFSRRLDSIR